MKTFSELGLEPALLKALNTEGYSAPTPIQVQAIPPVLAGRDLLGIAQTGTGKTAAFALPILQRLTADRRPSPRKGTRCLVLSPTRELATQIAESFRVYGKHSDIRVGVVFGGVAHKPQRDMMARGVDVLVATPGRLIDHMTERNIGLETTEILVLDEADQMMDLGFIRPLRQIIAKLPHRRQSMFFSATMPHEIGALAAELLRDPMKVEVAPVGKTVDRVKQAVIHVEASRKKALLAELFADPSMTRTLVFTRTKRGADRVAKHLTAAGVAVAAIHGNKSQGQREQALRDFKMGRIRGLVATDIAARGIDVDAVSHVVNFELPNVPESYVHRIGRTARAGAEGIAISFCDGEERAYLRDIERLTRQSIPNTDRRGDVTLAVGTEERHESRAEGDRRREPRVARQGNHGGGQRTPHRKGQGSRRDAEPRSTSGQPNRHNHAQSEGRRNGHTNNAAPNGARAPYDPLSRPPHRADHQGRDGEHRNRNQQERCYNPGRGEDRGNGHAVVPVNGGRNPHDHASRPAHRAEHDSRDGQRRGDGQSRSGWHGSRRSGAVEGSRGSDGHGSRAGAQPRHEGRSGSGDKRQDKWENRGRPNGSGSRPRPSGTGHRQGGR